MDALRGGAAWVSSLVAALHVFYAAQGGLVGPPAVAWFLALGTGVGAGLVWLAARRGPWGLAWLGLALLALPAALSWPAIGISAGGLLALLLLGVAALWVVVASFAGHPPPRQSHTED